MSENMNEKLRLECVTDCESAEVRTFLRLGGPYMAEIGPNSAIDDQRFLQSMLRRQGEPDRWLTLFMQGDQAVGFAHFKIDKDERPGSGYILEFYIIPERRRRGLGRECLSLITSTLTVAGCKSVWLASQSTAESFWRACGFYETGEFERDQKVLIKTVIARRNATDGAEE